LKVRESDDRDGFPVRDIVREIARIRETETVVSDLSGSSRGVS
jgi:hypothetical protein